MHILITNRGSPYWPWVLEWQHAGMRGVVQWLYQTETDAVRDAHLLKVIYAKQAGKCTI